MVKRAKAKAKAIEVDGRTYHPEFPPSEQNDVEKVTKRFKKMTPDQAAAVEITEEELRNFAKVYRRLYQVPPTSRDRLKAWAKSHENEHQGWDVGDFFKSKEDDEKDDTVPADAGPPQAAIDEFKRLCEAEAAAPKPRGRQQQRKSGANDDESNEEHSENDADSERRGKARKGEDSKDRSMVAAKQEHSLRSAAGPTLRPQVSLRDRQDADPVEELEAVLRLVEEVSAHLSHFSKGADERDHYKKPLSDLAHQLDTGVERAQQAKEAIVERLHQRSTLFDDSRDLQGGVKKRGRQGFEEASEEEQIRAKRAQAVASLPAVKAKKNAAARPPPLPREPGSASPYYRDPYQGHGSNAYGAAALQPPQQFQPSEQFQWSPPTATTADHSHAGRHNQAPGFDNPSRLPSQHHSVNASSWSQAPGRTPNQYRAPDQHRTTANTPCDTPSAHPGFAAPSHARHSLPAMHPDSAPNQPAAGYASRPSHYDLQGFPSSPLAHSGDQTHGSYQHNRNSERRDSLATPAQNSPAQNSEAAAGYTSHHPSNYDDHQGFPPSPLAPQPRGSSYHYGPNNKRREDSAARNSEPAGYAPHPPNKYDDSQGFPSSPFAPRAHGSSYHHNQNIERREDLATRAETTTRNSEPAGYTSHYHRKHDDSQGFPSSPLPHQTHGSSYHHNSNSEKREGLGTRAEATTHNSEPSRYTSRHPSNYDDHDGFPSSPLGPQAHRSSYRQNPNSEGKDLARAAPTQDYDDPNHKGSSNGDEAHAERREGDAGRKESEEDVEGQSGSED